MTTRQFTFSKVIKSISVGDDTVRLSQSINFIGANSKKKIKLVSGSVSRSIPNIFSYNGYNNGLVRVKRNAEDAWTDIQLQNGIYSVSDISNAINRSVDGWYTSVTAPAFGLYSNPVLEKCYIIIDSSKLAAGGTQFCIDFSGSDIYKLLGFVSVKTFSTNGTFSASDIAQVDTFGNLISVQLEGFGSISIVNSDSSNEICTIDMNTNSESNNYTIDTTSMIAVDIFPGNSISAYSIKLVGSRNNKQIIFLEGEIKLTFQIEEYE